MLLEKIELPRLEEKLNNLEKKFGKNIETMLESITTVPDDCTSCKGLGTGWY